PDVDGPADLVEEVVRIHGLEHVLPTPLPRHVSVAEPILTENQNRLRLAKRALAARGLNEAVTWSFIPEDHARSFGAGNKLAQLKMENPISSDLDTMRPSLLPGLIKAAGRNMDRGFDEVALFEAGPQFAGDAPEDQALVISGLRRSPGARHWTDDVRPVDAYDAKADALAALEAVSAPLKSVQVTDDAPEWYHPGRSGVIRLGPKTVLATFGEVHPRVLDALDVKGPLVGFEVFPSSVPQPKKKATKTRAPLKASDLPTVRRDFAFVVDQAVTGEQILRAAKGADKKLIVSAALFDVYEGKGIEEGKKSLAIEVTLQPRDKTLTDEEIDVVAQKVIAQVSKATGGVLRG
ncbi:phenylalanine--tRNA ligase subunit beta, partial [bacterium AH-315-P15]|nr:phenylalanine--tRNA ligase subunit beta [bacterium AH-315-P15]MBN4046496.1 phenylalanine--tRNA ligase subunit beta [bacterium AH-315-P15]